jgi:hypothetical protein
MKLFASLDKASSPVVLVVRLHHNGGRNKNLALSLNNTLLPKNLSLLFSGYESQFAQYLMSLWSR